MGKSEKKSRVPDNIGACYASHTGLRCIFGIFKTGMRYRKVTSSNHIGDFGFFSDSPRDKLINISCSDCLATSNLPSFPFSQSLLRNYVLDPVRVNNSPALSNLVPTEGIYFSLYASCHWIRSLNICFADDFVRAGKPLGSHR